MDLDAPKPFAKWVGLLLALLVPGSAQFLAGDKRSGAACFLLLLVLPGFGSMLLAVPGVAAIYLGLFLLVLTPALYLLVLIKSFRPIPRPSIGGWCGFVLLFIALNAANLFIAEALPVHPYKVSTGAMEPTLRGFRAHAGSEKPPFLDGLLKGCTHVHCRARASGPILQSRSAGNRVHFVIGDQEHELPAAALSSFRLKPDYHAGDTIWEGVLTIGDWLMADQLTYRFRMPARGDIVVFRTENIEHPHVRNDTVYVKRIVGLPGETVQISDGQLIISGKRIESPAVFKSLHYLNAGQLYNAEQRIALGPDEYLMFGDNTAPNMSLDGRFYGAIHRKDIVAKVQTIYWPISRIATVE